MIMNLIKENVGFIDSEDLNAIIDYYLKSWLKLYSKYPISSWKLMSILEDKFRRVNVYINEDNWKIVEIVVSKSFDLDYKDNVIVEIKEMEEQKKYERYINIKDVTNIRRY
jgi:hypothetical protein